VAYANGGEVLREKEQCVYHFGGGGGSHWCQNSNELTFTSLASDSLFFLDGVEDHRPGQWGHELN
jgi:hypothetical protein